MSFHCPLEICHMVLEYGVQKAKGGCVEGQYFRVWYRMLHDTSENISQVTLYIFLSGRYSAL